MQGPPSSSTPEPTNKGGPVVTTITTEATDDLSVNSASTYSTSTSNRSPSKNIRKIIEDKAAEILDKSKHRYKYETFPTEFDEHSLVRLGLCHRLSLRNSTVRKRMLLVSAKKSQSRTQRTAEVATFTLSFMAFSAMVGRELLEISDNPLIAHNKTILATYVHPSEYSDLESDEEESIPATIATSGNGHEEEFEDALSVNTDVAEKGTRPGEFSDDEEFMKAKQELQEPVNEKKAKVTREVSDPSKPRSRFQDSLSALQIEERKATGRAQFALAF
jgi:hypothetical protein